MLILVLNCGSSSIKADILYHESGKRRVSLRAERIGDLATASMSIDGRTIELGSAGESPQAALKIALGELIKCLQPKEYIGGVGHRVVHGGAAFSDAVRIDDEVEGVIESLGALAPLHNPVNLMGIRTARGLWPDIPHIAVFDTAFHNSMPRRATTYALNQELAKKYSIRRYGFHGPSHHYVATQAAHYLGADLRDLRLITCHLGNGASMAAVEYGRSIETTMGMTPLEGLVMGTRSGDIDPGVVIHLMREEGLDAKGLDTLLNKESGLLGVSGLGNDMRDIEEKAGEGHEAARLAILVFTHRIRKYIGAYAALMGGVDAIVFTAGIGENSSLIRHRVSQRLEFLGAQLDEQANRELLLSREKPVCQFSRRQSRCHLLAVQTDEEYAIAKETAHLVFAKDAIAVPRTIPVAVSARHVHLNRETCDKLFGEGFELTEHAPLSQPGQFASQQKVDLVGPKRSITGVRILGPLRGKNQIEISRSDEFHLGVDAPVRRSGDVANSPGIKLVGPAGEVELAEGLICAWRHIHMTTADAEYFGVVNKDIVEVAIDSDGRDLIFGDVMVRVSDKYATEMHIDTDEANAAEVVRGQEGMLVSTTSRATVLKRTTRFD